MDADLAGDGDEAGGGGDEDTENVGVGGVRCVDGGGIGALGSVWVRHCHC